MFEQVIERVSNLAFGIMCHQDPSLLMNVDGRVLPLCPRCVGLQTGFLVTFVILWMTARRQNVHINANAGTLLALALSALAADWGLGQFGILAPTSVTRLLTGVASGSALAVLFRAYLDRTIHVRYSRTYAMDVWRLATLTLVSLGVGLVGVAWAGRAVVLAIVLGSIIANASIIACAIIRILMLHITHLNFRINHNSGGTV